MGKGGLAKARGLKKDVVERLAAFTRRLDETRGCPSPVLPDVLAEAERRSARSRFKSSMFFQGL
jgi:hypothetical protein